MGVTINKEAVTGIRALLKYSVIRYSVAAAIVIGAVFGGLWLVKDAAFMEAFKRDDKSLNRIEASINELSGVIKNVADNQERQRVQLQKVEEMTVVGLIFNPNVPADKRANAFDRAKELHLNHDIKRQYREFVLHFPEAAWKVNPTDNVQQVSAGGGENGHWEEQKGGVRVFVYDK